MSRRLRCAYASLRLLFFIVCLQLLLLKEVLKTNTTHTKLCQFTDNADGEDLLVPNPNHHYVEESSSEEEEGEEGEDRDVEELQQRVATTNI